MLNNPCSEFIKRRLTDCLQATGSKRDLTRDNRTLRIVCQFSSVLVILFAFVQHPTADAQTQSIEGRWLLNPDVSTDTADELKGIRKSKKKKHRESPKTKSPGPTSTTQERYWQHANEGEEWKHSRELAHAGPIQRLLESTNLEIVPSEDGYLFIYADGYEREIVPNPGGRVFTASGEELVESEIGFTLAYSSELVLNLETRIKKGGQLFEQVSLSADGNTLTVYIEIDRRDWKWIAKVERVYDRVP